MSNKGKLYKHPTTVDKVVSDTTKHYVVAGAKKVAKVVKCVTYRTSRYIITITPSRY